MAIKTICCGASIRTVTLVVLCLMMAETVFHLFLFDFKKLDTFSIRKFVCLFDKSLAAARCFIYLASFIAIIIKNPCVKLLMFTSLTFSLVDSLLCAVYFYFVTSDKHLKSFIYLFPFLGLKIYATLVFYNYVVELKPRPIPIISIQSDVPFQEPTAPCTSGPSACMMIRNPEYYDLPGPYRAPAAPHSVQAPQFSSQMIQYPTQTSPHMTRP